MIKQLLSSSYKFKPRRKMNHKKSKKTEADVPKRENIEIEVRKEEEVKHLGDLIKDSKISLVAHLIHLYT